MTPDLFGPIGGIARISRATALAMATWASAQGGRLIVDALCDTADTPDPTYLPHDVTTYRAWHGDRHGLALAVAKAGWNRGGHATVFGHVNLAVTGLLQPPFARQALIAHGIEIWQPFPFRHLDRRIALRRQHVVWPISRYTAAQIHAAHGVPRSRLHVIPNALDPQWPLSETDRVPPTGRMHLLTVCRLTVGSRHKGIDVAIKALTHIESADRPILDIVGEGDDRARFEALATQLGVRDDVVFHGRLNDEALSALYAAASAFVLPSTHEGFGLVFIEAMVHGLPVLTVNAGAAPEVVEDGITGRVVPPHSPTALAAAIVEFLRDPAAALAMGRRGRAIVLERYTFPAYETRIHAALDALFA